MYCRDTACPIEIRESAVKYRIIAIKPTVQRRNIVFESLTFSEIPRLAAKAATAKAITAERTRIIIQTSTPSRLLVYLTRAFIVPKLRLPKIIHKTAIRGASVASPVAKFARFAASFVLSAEDSVATKEDKSGPIPSVAAISARPLPSPRLTNQTSPQRDSRTEATFW